MNEILIEMKEICDVWVKMSGRVKWYNQDEIHLIYDYITNLQQENTKLKEEIRIIKEHPIISKFYKEPTIKVYMGSRGYGKTIHKLQQENTNLKQRIDNAIDFINIYTNGINLQAFDCLKLMYKIEEILKGESNDN